MKLFLSKAKTLFKRFIKKSFFILIQFLFKTRKGNNFNINPSTICIIAQEKIGDYILLIPLFPLLKKYFPEIIVTIISSKYNHTLFLQTPDVDEVLCPKLNFLQFLKKIQKRKFDILYNPKDHSSITFLFLTVIINADYKIGIKHFHNNKYFDFLFEIPLQTYIVKKNLAICELFNITINEDDLIPKFPCSDNPQIEIYYENFQKPLVGINLSAGSMFREWKEDKWMQLFEDFSNQNVSFLLIGMSNKNIMMEKISNKYKNVFIMRKMHDIIELNNYIVYMDIIITPDTSILHLAQMNQIQTLCLFQKNINNSNRFFLKTDINHIIQSPTNNINDIQISLVVEKLISLLNILGKMYEE